MLQAEQQYNSADELEAEEYDERMFNDQQEADIFAYLIKDSHENGQDAGKDEPLLTEGEGSNFVKTKINRTRLEALNSINDIMSKDGDCPQKSRRSYGSLPKTKNTKEYSNAKDGMSSK